MVSVKVLATLSIILAVAASVDAGVDASYSSAGFRGQGGGKVPRCQGRGLVLSGGGDKGAYQAGALKALAEHGKGNWKYISGVAVGAINGLGLSMFPVGQEKDAAAFVQKLWNDLGKNDVYKDWVPGGRAQGLVSQQSLYDATPLRDYLAGRVDLDKVRTSGRKFYAGAVAAETGEFVSFREFEDDIMAGVLGSAAQPLMFSPVPARGLTWIDGGIKSVTPIKALIESVRQDEGCLLEDVDVVICHPTDKSYQYEDVKSLSTMNLHARVLDLMEDNANRNDMLEAHYLYGQRVKFTVVAPPFPLKTKILEFDHDDTMRMAALGEDDATQVLKGQPENDPHKCAPNDELLASSDRSTKVTIVNSFDTTLELFGADAEDDCFTECKTNKLFRSMPCHTIAPGESCTFASNSCSVMHGTAGHAYYRYNNSINNVIKIHWNNPFVGSNKNDCDILGKGVKCDIGGTPSGNHNDITVHVYNVSEMV